MWLVFERHYVAFADRLGRSPHGETTTRGKLAAMIRGFCQRARREPELCSASCCSCSTASSAKLASDTPTPVTP